MRLTLNWTAVALLCAAPGYCQLAEHAAAVAGGGMGVIAGKPVSNGITKVMGEVEKAPKKKAPTAPAAKAEEPSVKPAASPVLPYSSAQPVQSAAPVHSGRTRAVAVAVVAKDPEVVQVARPVEALVEPDLAQAIEGMKREELIAAVGAPASRVIIPEDEHLYEIYRYSYGDRWLGTVRLDNGSVVRVDLPQ